MLQYRGYVMVFVKTVRFIVIQSHFRLNLINVVDGSACIVYLKLQV